MREPALRITEDEDFPRLLPNTYNQAYSEKGQWPRERLVSALKVPLSRIGPYRSKMMAIMPAVSHSQLRDDSKANPASVTFVIVERSVPSF